MRKLNKRGLASRFHFKIDDSPSITDLTEDVLHLMLDNDHNGMPPERGLFIIQMDSPIKFRAVDNSTGDMLIEEFDDRFAAERWLREDKV